jgi:hypothetical protein
LPAITAYQLPNLSQTYSTLVGAGLPAMAACQPTNPSQVHAAQTVGAGLLAKTACQPTNLSQTYSTPVGTGLPAMAVCQVQQGWLGWRHRRQAELLRGGVYNLTIRPAVGRLGFAFAVHAPSRGREEVLRSGQPGMDAGLVAPGHGWPMAAGPRSRTGARACRAWARHRTKGARALWLLWGFSKVTRRKGGTLSRRYRNNGYVHPQNPHRLTQSLREQARSHRDCAKA